MRTADLCDLSDLVSGWHHRETESPPQGEYSVPDEDHRQFVNESPALSVTDAVEAIDRVLATYPNARWVTTGDHGRIICDGRLIGLSMAVVDEDAELQAWTDAATRLGNGNGWSAKCGPG